MDNRNSWVEWLGFKSSWNLRSYKTLGGLCGVLLTIVVLTLLAGAIGALGQFILAAFAFENPKSHEAIRNIGLVLAAVFGAPFIAWRSYVAHKQTSISEQSHITDQINKAVEGLGAEKTVKSDGVELTRPNIEVRIGAIYALERIAQDSPRDHVQIMEILTAYIRENAKAEDAAPNPLEDWPKMPDDPQEKAAHIELRKERFGGYYFESKAHEWARTLKARTDIQAAVQVIGRRTPNQIALERADTRYGDAGYRLDLRETNLQAVDISRLNFEKALLEKSRMEGANLRDARMVGAILRGARMERASLSGARMEGANLGDARMEGASLWRARMEGANLRGARMDTDTSLLAATLRGAAMRDVDYTDVSWAQSQIDTMFGDRTVILPEGLNYPAHWSKWNLDYATFQIEWREWRDDPDNYTPPDPPDSTEE